MPLGLAQQADASGALAASSAEIAAKLRAELAQIRAELPNRVAKAVVAALAEQSRQTAVEAARKEETLQQRRYGATPEEIAQRNGLRMNGTHELVCEPCEKFGVSRRQQAGVFSTDQLVATLRQSVLTHLDSPGHALAVAKERQLQQAVLRSHQSGINVGRAIYYGVKEGLSYRAAERTLVLLEESGCHIGTMNHGRDFAAKYVSSIYVVMQSRLHVYLDKPLPHLGNRKCSIAFCADKSTELRRTGQILGGLIMVLPA